MSCRNYDKDIKVEGVVIKGQVSTLLSPPPLHTHIDTPYSRIQWSVLFCDRWGSNELFLGRFINDLDTTWGGGRCVISRQLDDFCRKLTVSQCSKGDCDSMFWKLNCFLNYEMSRECLNVQFLIIKRSNPAAGKPWTGIPLMVREWKTSSGVGSRWAEVAKEGRRDLRPKWQKVELTDNDCNTKTVHVKFGIRLKINRDN